MNTNNKALTPIYVTNEVNERFSLYQGEMNFLINSHCSQEKDLQGRGSIEFSWFPSLRINYHFKFDESIFLDLMKTHELEIKNREIKLKANIRHQSISHKQDILRGQLFEDPQKYDNALDLRYLIFHLTNFHDYSGDFVANEFRTWTGRLLLESSEWRVTIDQLDPTEARKELIRSLSISGGYVITHVAKLERVDNQSFTPEQASDILSALSYFLAFVRGMWVGPIFPVGFDGDDRRVWELWDFYKASPYQGVGSWFPKRKPESVSFAFAKFIECWKEQSWNEYIKLLIHWYVESNLQAGAIEGSIIMAQSALELLHEFTEYASKNRKIDATKKLENLSVQIHSPVNPLDWSEDIKSVKNLRDYAQQKKIPISMPKALTEIRNAITHPKIHSSSINTFHSDALRIEAWRLNLWYLELATLHLFEYRGSYNNRLIFDDKGEYDELPWMQTSSKS